MGHPVGVLAGAYIAYEKAFDDNRGKVKVTVDGKETAAAPSYTSVYSNTERHVRTPAEIRQGLLAAGVLADQIVPLERPVSPAPKR